MANSRWTSRSAYFFLVTRLVVRPVGPLYIAPVPGSATSFLGFAGSRRTSATYVHAPVGVLQSSKVGELIRSIQPSSAAGPAAAAARTTTKPARTGQSRDNERRMGQHSEADPVFTRRTD